ncbi:hypothetical protein NLG97_g4881 [Lecanicillium saksenae]|uniref:Uncharacterized protein n=1 Tax=Lecanicillium saksenae TaxID=468837 RepID=A0ACC1QUK9_9HYPO|nr:hypothetical protein NLG97_g4881 [Lecanicillium saksenae]
MVKVEAAVAADALTLGAMQLNAFDDDYFDDMFVEPYTAVAWASFISRAEEASSGLKSRVSVIRDENGTAKAACLLYIAPDEDAVNELYGPWEESWGARRPDMNKDKLDAFFGGMKTQHKSTMCHVPHVYLEILMAHSTARRRGYGLALLEFANGIADELQMPLYLNSDEGVVGLYERVGYVRQPGEMRASDMMVPMVRPAVKVSARTR